MFNVVFWSRVCIVQSMVQLNLNRRLEMEFYTMLGESVFNASDIDIFYVDRYSNEILRKKKLRNSSEIEKQ